MHSKDFRQTIRHAPVTESLEQRVLLTSVQLDGQTLRIVGDNASESISITEATTDDFTVVRVDANQNGSFTDPGDLVMRYQGVNALDVRLLGGDDHLTINLQHTTRKQIKIDLGDGNDELYLQAGWHINYMVPDGYRGHMSTLTASLDVSVIGGAGNDVANVFYSRLQGDSQLNLKLDMGAGDDQVTFAYYQSIAKLLAEIGLGDGDDSCSFELRLYREPGGRGQKDIGTATVNMYGGEGKDTIIAYTRAGEPDYYSFAHPNLILGLYGGAGEDNLNTYFSERIRPASVKDDIEFTGTTGDDQILLSAGKSRYPDGVYPVRVTINGVARDVFVPSGLVTVRGLDGNDTITAAPDLPFTLCIYGGEGDDKITGNNRQSSLYGGAGDDLLVGGGRNDLIEGGEGDDTVLGNDGNDTLYGHDGNDSLDGGAGDDELYGNNGNDTLLGGDGSDYLGGNADNDRLLAGPGNDNVSGGLGADFIGGGDGDDRLLGGDGCDSISGDAGADHIEGKGKADTLYGGTGNDTIIGGAGADRIDGADGDDTLYADPSSVFRDTVVGGAGHDRYRADKDDVLSGVEEVLA